jgi:hypothetical protein
MTGIFLSVLAVACSAEHVWRTRSIFFYFFRKKQVQVLVLNWI